VKCYYSYGFIELSGKSGFSVGSDDELSITISIPNSLDKVDNFTKIEFIPEAALDPSLTINNTYGIPKGVHIFLQQSKNSLVSGYTTWTGQHEVVYSSSGNWGGEMKSYVNTSQISNPIQSVVIGELPQVVQVGSADVTQQIFSNTLTISLTFVVIALTFFTLRSKRS
jgi:hypothetical protein